MVHFEPAEDRAAELAPVTYLPGAAPGMKRRSPLEDHHAPAAHDHTADVLAQAENLLLSRLRRRSLSVAEARGALEGARFGAIRPADRSKTRRDETHPDATNTVETNTVETNTVETNTVETNTVETTTVETNTAETRPDEIQLDEAQVEGLITRFRDLGYLDDSRLAEQIVHTHQERKGLGRSGVEAEMRRRRLPPELIIEGRDALTDDEQERADALATKRAAQLSRFDEETIERRLTGFLMRKGYSSAVVRTAVAQAVRGLRGGGPPSTVRFR